MRKAWNILTAAGVAATLTLAGCTDTTPADVAAEDATLTPEQYDFMYRVLPAHDAAWQAAMDEIRRTFTVEDFRNERWVERWPEIWGPDARVRFSHDWPTIALANRLHFRMTERYGKDWEADEGTVAKARATLATELDRYVFDGHVERGTRPARK